MESITQEELISIKEYLRKEDGVLAAYIFGSSINRKGVKRDLDIALLVEDEILEEASITQIITSFYLKLSKLLKRKDIDIILLNRASLLFKYAVIKNGNLIYEKDEDKRIEFEVRAMRKYFDFLRIKKLFWKDFLNRLEDGRFAE